MVGREEHDEDFKRRIKNNLMRLPKYVKEWYNNLLASNISIRTCYSYIFIVSDYLKSICINTSIIQPEELTPVSLDNYFVSLKIVKKGNDIKKASDSRSVTAWFALKNFFDFLTNRNYIEQNYVKQINKPKNKDDARISEHRVLLDKEDFSKIMKTVNSNVWKHNKRDTLIIALLMTTGMRESALMEINLNDIDIINKKLYVVDKGEKIHEYILSDKIMNILFNYIQERNIIDPNMNADPLFINNKMERISVGTIKYTVNKFTKEALGKKLSPHKLRAGYCSILYDEKHDIEFVRRAVGHSSSKVTQRYIVTDNKEKVEASMIMNNIF